MNKRLTKGNEYDSMVSGVCSGLSEYFEIDVTILRLIWIMLTFYHGIGLIIYLILAIIMPNKN